MEFDCTVVVGSVVEDVGVEDVEGEVDVEEELDVEADEEVVFTGWMDVVTLGIELVETVVVNEEEEVVEFEIEFAEIVVVLEVALMLIVVVRLDDAVEDVEFAVCASKLSEVRCGVAVKERGCLM